MWTLLRLAKSCCSEVHCKTFRKSLPLPADNGWHFYSHVCALWNGIKGRNGRRISQSHSQIFTSPARSISWEIWKNLHQNRTGNKIKSNSKWLRQRTAAVLASQAAAERRIFIAFVCNRMSHFLYNRATVKPRAVEVTRHLEYGESPIPRGFSR